MKTIVILVLFCIGLFVEIDTSKLKVSQFKYEHSCVINGGYCVYKHECPHEIENKFKNLCPQQQTEGAVCCEGYPGLEKMSCDESHNECRPISDCNPNLTAGQKECSKGEVCCILV